MTRRAYSSAVADLWRHLTPGKGRFDRSILLHYAILAASSHNTQPWKFRLAQGHITILPDLGRRCSAVDPDDHHLYASLGCAAENLLLAAEAFGFKGYCTCDVASPGIRIDLETAAATRSVLFDAIPHRQCTRAEYDGSPLSPEQVRIFEATARGNGVSTLLILDAARKERIAEYVAAGNSIQFADRAWANELRSWVRFSSQDAMRSSDGLYGPVMGSPDVPRWLGKLAMRLAFSAGKQNRKDIAHIRSSSAIAVIFSEADNMTHWIEAGRCYERLALQATAMGLRTALINQPIEVSTLRPQFATFLGLGNRRVDLIVRIGRGPDMPRSLRRPVGDVVIRADES